MSKEEEVKKIWKTFTDKRGISKFQPKDLLNLIDILAGQKTNLHAIQIIQMPGVSMIVNSLNKKHPPDKTMYIKGLNTLAKHIKEKYKKDIVKENDTMYNGKYDASMPSARYTEFVPVKIPDSYASNGIMRLAKNWLDKYGANGYSHFDKPHYAGMPKDIVNKMSREEIEVIQHYWPKYNLDEVKGIHSHGITPEKVSYKVSLPSEYPYNYSGRYSIVLLQAKRWLDKYGTNGYEVFDYPEYAGMPDNIANKLSSDEVDFIQTHWPGMGGEVSIDDAEMLRTDEGYMLPKVLPQKSQMDKAIDSKKTLTGPDAKAAAEQLRLARQYGGWDKVPEEEKEILRKRGLLGEESVYEAKYQGREVPLGKPMQGDVKKKKVYVKKPNGKVVKVNFGDKNMRIKKSNPKRRKSFRARHNCKNPGPRWKARYWSCRSW